jgi:methionyl-tRNA formyltransferase
MFDTIILLTGPVEAPVLAAVLRNHNPQLAICPVKSLAELEAFEPALLRHGRLIAFATSVLVPPRILVALGGGAYNFHPGPPHYPGWAPAHFAIYDKASYFGATAHVMIEQIDAGPIVGVELFGIPPQTSVLRLQELAFVELARLFWSLAPALATQSKPLAELPIKWSGTKSTRRMYAAMCDIPRNIAKDELERRIEVFGTNHYGIDLTITLHGQQFRYAAPDADLKAESPSIVPTGPKVVDLPGGHDVDLSASAA